MKTKFNGILTLLLVLIVQISFAQDKTISGTVSDESGPLPGVTVLKKGSTQGTETDFDGKYSIKAKAGDVLVFSFIGMKTTERTVSTSNNITVIMDGDNVLDEVVVTALGLEKKKDEDLSSSTVVRTAELQRSGESGVIQGLAGKTSGVNITKNSGDPGAGAYIQIRGQNTIIGSNQPLIVLDGVIITNQSIGSGSTSGVVQQSRLNDIPAEDIKSVTVLKGAAAAAVYGTGAANGALIITTKRGSASGKKWSVNVKSAVSIDNINIEFEKQSKFGQGTSNKYLGFLGGFGLPNNSNAFGAYQRFFNNGLSWGDKISDRSGGADGVIVGNERFVSNTGRIIYPYSLNASTNTINKNSRSVYNDINRNAIFGTGIALDNSINLSHASDDSRTFISASKFDQKGIIKNGSDYIRNTFRINQETNFSKSLTGKISANFVNIKSDRVQQGSNLNGLYLGYLRTPADFDIRDYKGTYYNAAGVPTENAHRGFRDYLGSGAPTYNNPLWTTNEQVNTSDVHRFIVAPEFSYKISENISATGRYGLDYYVDDRVTFFPFNSAAGLSTGSYGSSKTSNKVQTWNAFLNGNHKISDNFDFSWIAGFQAEQTDFESIGGSVTNFTNPVVNLGDIRDFGNSTAANQTPGDSYSHTKKNGAYTVLNATVYDQLFLELTGRFEKISSVPNRNIFYPSASLGWQFSKSTGTDNTFSFGKLRLSYGEVGVAPPPYLSQNEFVSGGLGSSWGDTLNGALFGSTFTRTATLGNPNIKEERIKEFEIGTDLRFFNNRVTLGATYYKRKTEDALLSVGLPASTGFTQTFDNAAEIENKGIEIDLGATIISTEDLNWKMNVNFSKNENIVTKLEGSNTIFLNGFTGTSSNVVEGHPFGVLYGGRWKRDSNGEIALDANGFPDEDPASGVIGDPNPDWKGAVSTSLTWKNITLSGLVETSQGNDVWNGTRGVLNFFGINPETANEVTVSAADAATIVNFAGTAINALPNVSPNADGSYTVRGNIKDFGAGPKLLDESWYTERGGGFGNVDEQFVEDGSWIKLREISISYALPSKYLEGSFLNSFEFGVTGRNLYTWTDAKGFDPESNLTGASRGRGLEYFTNPSTSSYVMTLKLGF